VTDVMFSGSFGLPSPAPNVLSAPAAATFWTTSIPADTVPITVKFDARTDCPVLGSVGVSL
jgi:hypothetical protein